MLLTDEELDVLAKPFSGMGGVEDYRAYARAVSAACEAKLREQNEPKGYLVYFNAKLGRANVTDRLFVWRKELATNQVNADLIQKVVPVFEHPAPIPEGWRCPVCNTDLQNEHSYNCVAAVRRGE